MKLLEEEMLPDELSFIDPYWIEISMLLLTNAPDDIQDKEQVQYLIQKLKEVRRKKLDSGLTNIDPRLMELKNIGFHELNRLKPHFIEFSNLITDYNETLLASKLQAQYSRP